MKKAQNKQQIIEEQDEIEDVAYGSPVEGTVTLPLDLKNPDRTWEDFGVLTYKIFLQNQYGKKYDNHALKAITQNKFCRAVVSQQYLVIPHEPINKMVDEFVKDPSNKMVLLAIKDSFHGLNRYWILLGTEELVLENSHKENDRMKFGVVIRNSLGGRLAFGIDMFTFRNACSNGAIFGFKDFGSTSIRHFGSNVEGIANTVFASVKDAMGRAADIMNYYQKFAATKFGNNVQFYEDLISYGVSQKFLPEKVEVIRPNKSIKGKDERKIIIPKSEQSKTYWEVFNDLTANIWHEKDLGFDSVRFFTKKLHDVMIDHAYGTAKKREKIDRTRSLRHKAIARTLSKVK